ncbi:MAG: tetratricopeptide repeat protein [Pseudomonadota bacterium]
MKTWFSRLTGKAAAPAAEPDTVSMLIAQGQQREDLGEVTEALALYQQALALAPQSVSGFINQGNALQLSNDYTAAIASYRQALVNEPGSFAAWLNLGNALLNAPKPDQATRKALLTEAEAAYRAALRLRPDWAEASFGLGCVLEEDGDLVEEACAAYRRASELDPAHDKAVFNLADLEAAQLLDRKELGAARRVLRDGLARHPGHHRLLIRLSDLERDCGQLRTGLKLLREVVDNSPTTFNSALHTVLLFALNFLPEITAEELFAAHRRFGGLAEQAVQPLRLEVDLDPDRRLRVGYVSPDFRQHPVANFIMPVLRHHDRSQVEVFCYHNHDGDDEATRTIRGLSDGWRDIAKLGDEMVAKQIVEDGIDVLVDLAGHTSGNRLMVFAKRPAPVQITWLGYLGTTGLSRMDYRVCDAYTDPPGESEVFHSEQLLRLPDSQWCYEQVGPAPLPPTPLPYLTHGVWTFASYNNPLKLNEKVFAMWAAVLKAFPGSRLRVFGIDNHEMETWVRSQCTGLGITSDRLICVPRTHVEAYYASAADVDLALDCFPYSGGTTTCDNLLMGLPVASVAGTRTIARSGVSLLNVMGLQDWLAASPQAMPDLLRRQLAEPGHVAALRAELPSRMRASALMDGRRFTKNLEMLYREGWRRWCASK